MTLLEITNVTKDFGGLEALSNVSMQLNDGDIISLIGPNGAGKTTLFNCITGTMPPTSGSIKFLGTLGTWPTLAFTLMSLNNEPINGNNTVVSRPIPKHRLVETLRVCQSKAAPMAIR